MIYKAGDNAVDHDGIEHAGFLSFMGILALFPFLVFFVAILGALGQTTTGAELINLIFENAPAGMLEALRPRIEEILTGPPQGLLTVSILGTLWTSSSMMEGWRTVLNKAYRVHTPPNYWLRRLFSISQILMLVMTLLFGVVLLVFLPVVYSEIVAFVNSWNEGEALFNQNSGLFFSIEGQSLRAGIIFLVLTFFVFSLYYILPNVKQSFRKTIPGAMITAAGWFGTAKLLSYYFENFDQFNVVYGSLGSVIAFLIFFYIINVIFIYGAEFNYLLEKSLGGRIEQKEFVDKKDIKAGEEHNREEELEEEKQKAKKKGRKKSGRKKSS